MDDATQKLVDEAPAWLDRHGDVWVFRNGMGWSFETRPFTREHIEKKWGPLVPLEAAQRPPVSPEVEEEISRVVREATAEYFREDLPEDGRDETDTIVDAILARFSVPSQPEVRDLAVRANPEPPSDDHLEETCRLGGLRAVWRNGCDAGMVAP